MNSRMTMIVIGFGMLISMQLAAYSWAETNHGFPQVAPESVGWSSEKLAAAAEYARENGSAAILALQDGKIIFSWGLVDRKFQCHSIRKPFLSALYGIYAARGFIDLDATLADLKIDDISPKLTDQEKTATVRDLLKARSGVYHEAAAEIQSMRDARPERGSHAPGTFYYYNNWDFNALGTIFERQTGKKIFEAFDKEIAGPIGMTDFSPADCWYSLEPEKSKHPAYCFRMTARDMARFALLYQNNGRWNGRQIIPEQWVAESTARYSVIDPESGLGCGYMWRIFPDLNGLGRAVFHTGYGVHLLGTIPKEKLVVIHRVDTDGGFRMTGKKLDTLVNMILAARLPSP